MRYRGFTLVELMVVVAIVALLLGVLVPALSRARESAELVTCGASLRSVGQAVYSYANDHRNTIPFGPRALPATSTNFYPITGFVTSLLSLESGEPVGLGLLLEDYLADQPEVLFCPGADSDQISRAQLQYVGSSQAQSSYWYRHGSAVKYLADPVFGGELVQNNHIQLHNMGENSNGDPIRALAMDTNFLADDSLVSFGVVDITHHQQEAVNVLLIDGSVDGRSNSDRRYTVDVGALPHFGPRKILSALESADRD
jgi:prepilin-type N-terminal cleavage/methylation domain-containing protein